MTTYGPSTYDYDYPPPESYVPPGVSIEQLPLEQRAYSARSPWLPVPFVFAMVLCGVSWISGGIPLMTDIGMMVVALASFLFLATEFINFPKRFGIGGLMIFGGFLVWISYDYNDNWSGLQATDTFYLTVPPSVVAKSTFFHCMFLACALLGLRFTMPKLTNAVVKYLPEPKWNGFYMAIVLITFVIGIAPYAIFTREGLVEAVYKTVVNGRTGGVEWTVGRTGNVNYNWGGYVVVIMKLGQIGSQFAAFYALMLARAPLAKIICWAIWLLHFALGFGSGTRGEVAFMGLPVLALLFLKWQLWAVVENKSVSIWGYIAGAVVLLGIVVAIQIQATFRDAGYENAKFSDVDVLKLKGNSMFTEGLPGWTMIPDRRNFFSNRFPGEGLVRAYPETAFNFVVQAIPRALWNDKPIDGMRAWYNALITGRREDQTEGTTITCGLVSEWYFRYGIWGVIQGGLLFGALARFTETILYRGNIRPLATLLAIGICVWLFRSYRVFFYGDLYPLLIGVLFLVILVRLSNVVAANKD